MEIRHARYNAGLIASSLYNVNRGTAEIRALTPFDFIPGFQMDPEEEEQAEKRRSIKHAVGVALSRLPDDVTPEGVQAWRDRTVTRLKAQGFEDAEELVREVLPDGGH